ncbi:hypothetical protein DENIT_20051 [Pseudomonas veronii]|nr:hypothetical protein DENIT_20051 [Pseudomonas veronii]
MPTPACAPVSKSLRQFYFSQNTMDFENKICRNLRRSSVRITKAPLPYWGCKPEPQKFPSP